MLGMVGMPGIVRMLGMVGLPGMVRSLAGWDAWAGYDGKDAWNG